MRTCLREGRAGGAPCLSVQCCEGTARGGLASKQHGELGTGVGGAPNVQGCLATHARRSWKQANNSQVTPFSQ